jgi:hypothetical protein
MHLFSYPHLIYGLLKVNRPRGLILCFFFFICIFTHQKEYSIDLLTRQLLYDF